MLSLDITGVLGKVITPSLGIPERELERAGETTIRAVSEWLRERETGQHAWTSPPYDRRAKEEVLSCAQRLLGERVDTVVWVGIGGSGLGPRVIAEAFESAQSPEFLVVDSVDPAVLQPLLQSLDWRRTALVVASKSGDTLESMSAFFLLREKLIQALGDRATARMVAVTDPQSGPLRTLALSEGMNVLPVPSGVGGRYSVFTPVGLLPLALLGADVEGLLRGAREMDTLCRQSSLDQNLAALLATVQYVLDVRRGYPIRVVMSYVGRLATLARWEQQLLAESLGKSEAYGPTPLAAVGTQDQHSLLQQWLAGRRNCWHLLLREDEHPPLAVPELPTPALRHLSGAPFGAILDACLTGTVEALRRAKRPTVVLSMPSLDAAHLGQLLFLLMAEVVLLSKLYRIDPYGQPAVEYGKKVARALLQKGKEG